MSQQAYDQQPSGYYSSNQVVVNPQLSSNQVVVNPQMVRSISPSRVQVVQSRPQVQYAVPQFRPVYREEEPLIQEGRNSTSNLLILALPALVALIFFVTSLNLISGNTDPNIELKGADRVFQFVFNNLDSDPVLDVLNEPTGGCPQDYEQFEVGTWQGISSGCLCEDGKVKESYECKRESESSCQRVTTSEPQLTYIWRTLQYCAKTTENLYRQFTLCTGTGEVKCANEFCARDGKCPYNKFTLNSAVGPQVNFGNNQQVKFEFDASSALTSRPLVNFQFSPGTTVCYDNQLAPSLASTKSYPLFKQKWTQCGRYGSLNQGSTVQYTQTLAQMPLQLFYTQNTLDTGLNLEPWWTQYQVGTDNLNLLAVQKIAIVAGKDASKCLLVDKEDFKVAADYAIWGREKLHTISWFLLISSIVVLVVGALFIFVLFYAQRDYQKVNVAKVFIAGGFILVIIAIIGSLFYFIVVEHKLSRANTSLRGIRVNECFLDSGLNLAIDDMDRYHTRTSELFLTSNWIYLICSILYLLIWIALCFYMKGKSSKSYYSEEEK